MSAFLEFHLKGGGCALVDASMIGAAIAKGTDLNKVGTADSPTLVVLRAGETLEVINQSVVGVMGRVALAKIELKRKRYADPDAVFVDYLTPLEDRDEPTDGAFGA